MSPKGGRRVQSTCNPVQTSTSSPHAPYTTLARRQNLTTDFEHITLAWIRSSRQRVASTRNIRHQNRTSPFVLDLTGFILTFTSGSVLLLILDSLQPVHLVPEIFDRGGGVGTYDCPHTSYTHHPIFISFHTLYTLRLTHSLHMLRLVHTSPISYSESYVYIDRSVS